MSAPLATCSARQKSEGTLPTKQHGIMYTKLTLNKFYEAEKSQWLSAFLCLIFHRLKSSRLVYVAQRMWFCIHLRDSGKSYAGGVSVSWPTLAENSGGLTNTNVQTALLTSRGIAVSDLLGNLSGYVCTNIAPCISWVPSLLRNILRSILEIL